MWSSASNIKTENSHLRGGFRFFLLFSCCSTQSPPFSCVGRVPSSLEAAPKIQTLSCALHEVPLWQSRVDVHHWARYLKSELLLVSLPPWAHIHCRFPATKYRSYPFWKRGRRSCQSVVTPSAHVSKVRYWQSQKCSLRCKKESRYHFEAPLNTQALKMYIIAFSFVLLFAVSSKENASTH